VATKPSREQLLSLDIDLRLTDLWLSIWEIEDWDFDIVGAVVRMAYGCGYRDALTDDPPGKLYRDHGFGVPQRAQ
jgi:hypothetical protein